MSYEIGKSIQVDEKNNKIFLTSCCNNYYPHTMNKWEYCKDDKYSFKQKICNILRDLAGGNLTLPKSNKRSCILLELKMMIGNVYDSDDDMIYPCLKKCEEVYRDKSKKLYILQTGCGVCGSKYILKDTGKKLVLTGYKEYAKMFNMYQVDDIQKRFDYLTLKAIKE